MSGTTLASSTRTKLPRLADVLGVKDPAVSSFLATLKELIEIREGLRGQALDRFATLRDLENIGVPTGGGGGSISLAVKKAAVSEYAASTTLSAGLAVKLDASRELAKADYATIADASRVLGVLESATSVGANGTVIFSGLVECTSWSWTVGQPIFLGSNGAMTQSVPDPATASFLMLMGIAVGVNSMLVRVSDPVSAVSITSFTGAYLGMNLATGLYTLTAPDHGLLDGLGDDDHTQYHNDARALTWLALQSILTLADTPSSMAGSKKHHLAVNEAETSLEWVSRGLGGLRTILTGETVEAKDGEEVHALRGIFSIAGTGKLSLLGDSCLIVVDVASDIKPKDETAAVTRDDEGRVDLITVNGNYSIAFTRDDDGNITTITYNTGIVKTLLRDDEGRISGWTVEVP